jgi:hypothetical protein
MSRRLSAGSGSNPERHETGAGQGGLDDRTSAPKNGALVTLVEVPDPDGHRWQAALELLLEAGRTVEIETGREQ